MKRVISLLVIILIIMQMGFVFSEEIYESAIHVGVDNHQPPYSYVNDNGIIKGFYLDVVHAIGLEMGVDIEISTLAKYQLIEDLIDTKEIDAIVGVDDSEFDDLVYSDPIISSADTIFVRYDNTYIINLEDIRNSRVAVQKKSLSIPVVSKYVDSESIVYVDNQQQGIQMIMMGQVDCFIGDRLSGLYTVQKWKQDDFIKIVGDEINSATYRIAFREDKEELIDIFNEGLDRIKKNGIYDKIYNKWFGDTLEDNSRMLQIITFVLIGVIVFALLIVGVILRWNNTLKKEVDKRTDSLNQLNNRLIDNQKNLEMNARFKEEILESMITGIVTIDQEKQITFLNDRCREIMDMKTDDLLGKVVEASPFDVFFSQMDLEKTLSGGAQYKGIEVEVVYNQHVKTYNCNLYPLKSSDDLVMGALLNFKDITEEKKLRNEFIRKDRMRAFGLLVAGLAHEIRNPLTSIKTLVDLMPVKIDNDRYREQLLKIVPNEIERLNNLITDLLEYSKPKPANKNIFDVSGLIEKVEHLVSENINNRNISFVIHDYEDCKIRADENQMTQVLINLLLNSIDALEQGGEIQLDISQENHFLSMKVIDDGQGITEKDLNLVFEPFYTTKSDGTGLGLFTSYQIMRENDGELYIDSEEGIGTTVTMLLPLA